MGLKEEPSPGDVATPASSTDLPFPDVCSSASPPSSPARDQTSRLISAESRRPVGEHERDSSRGDGCCSGERVLEQSEHVEHHKADDIAGEQPLDSIASESVSSLFTAPMGESGDIAGTGERVSEHAERVSEHAERPSSQSPSDPQNDAKAPTATTTAATPASRPALSVDGDSGDERPVMLKQRSSPALDARVGQQVAEHARHVRSGSWGGKGGGLHARGKSGVRETAARPLLLEHPFFWGLPGWGGPGQGGVCEESEIAACSFMSPELDHVLDLHNFDPK